MSLFIVQQPRLFCHHLRKDALYGILSAEEKLPAADTKSHTGDFSAHSETLSFPD
jgi:hypothetical protein